VENKMAIPVCNLNFTPIIPNSSFQIALITDVNPVLLKNIDPANFIPDNMFLKLDSTLEPPTHQVMFLNETPYTKILRVRNLSNIPGAWSETVSVIKPDILENTVPFYIDINPMHTAFSMNLRWQLENSEGDIYGTYIGTNNNIKYIPSGEYILRIIDLAGNIFEETNINTDEISKKIYIDIGIGKIKIVFNIPGDKSIEDFSYHLISDFGDTSLADNYNNTEYELTKGLYYIVVKYKNDMLQPKDNESINLSIYVYEDLIRTLTITIDEIEDVLKIASITEE